MRQRSEAARLVLVDDHELVRNGLKRVLARAAGLSVVGEAASGDEALQVCAQLRPDLVLIDLELGIHDGLSVTRAIREAWPSTDVVVFSINEGEHYRHAAVRAGAAGYVLKGVTRRELLRAVREVLKSGGLPSRTE